MKNLIFILVFNTANPGSCNKTAGANINEVRGTQIGKGSRNSLGSQSKRQKLQPRWRVQCSCLCRVPPCKQQETKAVTKTRSAKTEWHKDGSHGGSRSAHFTANQKPVFWMNSEIRYSRKDPSAGKVKGSMLSWWGGEDEEAKYREPWGLCNHPWVTVGTHRTCNTKGDWLCRVPAMGEAMPPLFHYLQQAPYCGVNKGGGYSCAQWECGKSLWPLNFVNLRVL